jgi:hypothetical protein
MLEKQVADGEISYSRMVEILNEIAGLSKSTVNFDLLGDKYLERTSLMEGTYKGDVQTAFVIGMICREDLIKVQSGSHRCPSCAGEMRLTDYDDPDRLVFECDHCDDDGVWTTTESDTFTMNYLTTISSEKG